MRKQRIIIVEGSIEPEKEVEKVIEFCNSMKCDPRKSNNVWWLIMGHNTKYLVKKAGIPESRSLSCKDWDAVNKYTIAFDTQWMGTIT